MSNTTTTTDTAPTNPTSWGYQPDGYDPDDPPYIYNGNWVGHSDSGGVSLLDLYPGAFQSDLPPTGSCVVDAVAGLITYLQYTQSNSVPSSATPIKTTPPITQQPSRRFMYYNGRAVALMKQQNNSQAWPTGFTDTGVSIRDAFNGINTFGLVSDGEFPWLTQNIPTVGNVNVGVNDLPPEGLYSSAANTPLFAPARLDAPASPKVVSIETTAEYKAEARTTLFHVQQCLWEGFPVIFAFHYYWPNFRTVSPPEEGGYPTIRTPTHEEEVKGPGPNFPTHVGMIIAYENDGKATRVLVKSMWGDNDIPYFWMPYDWILNFKATEGFWTLRVSNATPPQREIIQTSAYTFTKCQSSTRVPSMETPVVASNGSIACISRGPGILDLFWRMDSGGVNRSYKYPETPWAWTCVPPDELGLPAGGQGAVAAISPDPSVMYLFWIGGDGSVWYVKTEDGGLKIETSSHSATGWDFEHRVTISPPGTADIGGGLAVTMRASGDAYDPQGQGTVQLYWIGSGGSVEVANNFIKASEWQVQPQIAGPGSAARCSSIAAAVDLPHYWIGDGYEESVWWISPDNHLKAMLNAPTGTDNAWQDISPDCVALKGSRIAVGHCVDSRNAFYLSPTGVVHLAKSYMGGTSATDQPLSSTALVRADSDISAVSTGMDVVVAWTDNYSGLSSSVMSSGSVTALSGPWLIVQGGSIGVATVVDSTQVAYISPLWGCCCDSWPAPSSPST
ncbi:hypothetical protein FPHYL_13352 [Fusarium phyllophilum]|uniref:Uncharacterized protein n=1 Tax=Fusarium phyllophilum TaxID=47803 RepID=A0A8H5IF97_9HYPO|nr:hypothetical protein FPHYL_13352 [Fusarium phyllophilum]